MSTRNADVNLIVRAKTEGQQAIAALGSSLDRLVNGATAGSQDFAELGRALSALDKAAANLATAQDKVGASAGKQAAAIHEANAGVAEQQERVETLRRGLEILSREADKAFVGPRRDGLTETLKLVKSELRDAEKQVERFSSSFDRNLAALQTSRSGLLGLKRTTAETAEAQATAAAAVELTTRALNEQAAAARSAAAAQSFYNAKGGPTGTSASANGATTDALVQHFQRITAEAAKVRAAIDPVGDAVERYEARIRDVRAAGLNGIIGSDEAVIRERQLRRELDLTIAKIAEGAARIREERKNAVTEYQALINGLTGVSGTRAKDSGATFDALDARERQAENDRRARHYVGGSTVDAANAAGGVGSRSATQDGATFSALAAKATDDEAQALREAAQAYQRFEQRVRDGAAALKEQQEAAERDTLAIQRLRDKIDPAAAIQRRLNEQLEEVRRLAGPAGLSIDEVANAEARLQAEAKEATDALKRQNGAGAGGAFKASLFGLKPYELQNLSYQVNDVITGLASGQRITQIIAQQSGQILQLFPKVGGALVGTLTNPAILGFAATTGIIALGLKAAADHAERLRNATADLGRRTNGGDYKAADISNEERDLERLGATAEQARAALNTFIDAGVPAQSLKQFGRVAQETAEVLGTDLPSAAKDVATAFTGGYQAIAELDNRLNFLNQTQRDNIRTLFEQGHAQEAQRLALDIYTQKMDTAATSARGPWATANRDLTKSWYDLLDSFANTRPIQAAASFINGLAGAVSGLAKSIDDISSGGGLTEMSADLAEIAALKKALSDPAYTNENYSISRDTSNAALRERLKAAIANYNEAARSSGKSPLDASGNPTASAPSVGQNRGPTTGGDTPLARERRNRIIAINDEDELQRLRDAGQQRLLTEAEKVRREQLAGAIAFRQEQDAAVGAIQRQKAAAHETATIQKETRTVQDRLKSEARQAEAEREQTIKRYLQRIGAAEGGTAANGAGSRAVGIGQFLPGTFVDTYRKANPGTSLNYGQIADLRRNPAVATQILDLFTRQNAQFLTSLGQAITGANLYLIHFLGKGTGGALLRATPDTPVDQVINRVDPHASGPKGVLALNRSYLFDKKAGRYRTRAELQSFLGNRVGDAAGIGGTDSGSAAVAIETEEARLIENTRKQQEALNLSIRHGNEDRARSLDALTEQEGKFGGELIDVQRTQAGVNAVDELRQRVEDINRALPPGAPLVTVTPGQVAAVRELATSLFDVQHARERLAAVRDDAQRPIDDLQEQQQLLKEQAELLRSAGDDSGAAKIDQQLDELTPKLQEAYDKLIAFYRALTPTQQVQLGILDQTQLDNIIAKLEHARDVASQLPRVLGVSGNTFLSAFSGAAATAFENFIKNVASGKNVFKSFAAGVKEFVASFALSLAEAIIKTLAFVAALTALSAITGIPVQALAAAAQLGAAVHHTGGIVGQGTGQTRRVPAAVFAGAMRYHTGGIVGLAPDEQAAVLRKGEEVLTENNPRHRNNGGRSAGGSATGGGDLNVITLFKEEHVAERLLRTRAGSRTILNIISENADALRATLR